jgi:hypothetical protein
MRSFYHDRPHLASPHHVMVADAIKRIASEVAESSWNDVDSDVTTCKFVVRGVKYTLTLTQKWKGDDNDEA